MRCKSPSPQHLVTVSQPHGRARQWLLAAAASSVLAACGGGDGPAAPATVSALAITSAASDSAAQPGTITNTGTTDDTTPTLRGNLAAALSSGQKLNVYDGSSLFSAAAVVNGTHWTFTPAAPLKNGLHRFTVEVTGFDGVATGSRSQPYVINVLVNETAPPAAPVLTVDDVANTVGGYNPATMEASLDKVNWSAVLPTLSGAVTLYVRVKASGITPAGLVATLDFTPNTFDPAPIAGGAFASLADMTVSDQAGGPIIPINAGGVTDPLGRTIVYSATGLPAGLSINSSTGVISGKYDSNAIFGQAEAFTVIVKAQATGSSQSASKQFILSIRNDG